jgi:hypothetical protein
MVCIVDLALPLARAYITHACTHRHVMYGGAIHIATTLGVARDGWYFGSEVGKHC